MSDWLWTAFWIGIIGIIVVADLIAATNERTGDTLTERIRAGMRRWRWFRIVLVAFLAWAAVHLLAPAGFV